MMVTGRDDVASINQSYQAGATDFLAKPINWNLLGHRVQYLVRGGRLVQELEESEGRQRAMLDALPDLLLVVDAARPHRRSARAPPTTIRSSPAASSTSRSSPSS